MTVINPKVALQYVSIVIPITTLPADVPIRPTIRMIQTAMARNCVGKSITAVALITDTVTPDKTINAENKNT